MTSRVTEGSFVPGEGISGSAYSGVDLLAIVIVMHHYHFRFIMATSTSTTSTYIVDRIIAFYQHLYGVARESQEFHNMCADADIDPDEFEYRVEDDYQSVVEAVDECMNTSQALSFILAELVRGGRFDVILGEMEQTCFAFIREIADEVPEGCPWPAMIAEFVLAFIANQAEITIGQLVGQS
jgi:hypothetical protein